jgi:cation:H+ antiporter
MIENVSLFILGLIILVAGAEALIRGSVRVARSLGVSPFMIGFTLIGFGTSAPELVVSLSAALKGNSDIALGNVVGSNIANIGLVLGVGALVRPLAASMRMLRVEVPLVILVSVVLWVLCGDNRLGRIDGIVLLAGFAAVCAYMYRGAREEPAKVKEEVGKAADVHMRVWVACLLAAFGIAGLVGGAHLVVEAAVEIAKSLGVGEWLIGLTVVAIGTSLPEVAAAVAAASKGESDLVLGNVVGSNLFNVLLILGTTVAVQPIGVPDDAIRAEIPAMVGFSLLLLAVVGHGMKIHRWEGAILLTAYAGFIAWQVAAQS